MTDANPGQNIRLLKMMKEALDRDLLHPSFKPLLQVRFPTRKSFLVGCELQAGSRQIPYGNLEKLARLTGTSAELDRWLLQLGLKTLKKLHREEAESLVVIPQSLASLYNLEYPQRLERQKELLELSFNGLVIAFRLSAISRDPKQAQHCLSALHEMGIDTMIEGFSQHPTALKLLRPLGSRYVSVSEKLQKGEDGVVEHRIQACHHLGIRILLPAIDTPGDVNLHWSAGADLLAGDYIHPAIPDTDFRFAPVIV